MQAEDLLLNFGTDMYNNFYVDRYKGIARANAAIEAMPNCGVAELNQYMGEAFFLRAWYYYELASMFGNIPCPVSSQPDPAADQRRGALGPDHRGLQDCSRHHARTAVRR